jgi:hypothetical protein
MARIIIITQHQLTPNGHIRAIETIRPPAGV